MFMSIEMCFTVKIQYVFKYKYCKPKQIWYFSPNEICAKFCEGPFFTICKILKQNICLFPVFSSKYQMSNNHICLCMTVYYIVHFMTSVNFSRLVWLRWSNAWQSTFSGLCAFAMTSQLIHLETYLSYILYKYEKQLT